MAERRYKFSGYLEPVEVRAIIDAIPLVSRHPERDMLLLEVLWQSGARVTEALTLIPEWVSLTSIIFKNLKQTKSLTGKDGKVIKNAKDKAVKVRDEDAVKDVEVSKKLCQRLKDFCDRNNIKEGEYIFKPNRKRDGHLTREYVWWMMDKASCKARIYKLGKRDWRTGRRVKGAYPHILRHSNAMKLLEETGDISLVQEQLGHSDVKTTQGYAYTKKPKIKRVVAKIKW